MFTFESGRMGDTLYYRASGFASHDQSGVFKEKILTDLDKCDAEGRPYRILFDLRGFKALDPRALKDISEIDERLYVSSAIKVGTVFDSLIARMQHIRTASNSTARAMLDSGRSRIFTSIEECRAWLASDAVPADRAQNDS